MKIGKHDFSPTLVPSLVTLALLSLLLWLGNWQMGKADIKFKDRTLRENVDRSRVIELKPSMMQSQEILAHHVRFNGEFDSRHLAVLANIKYRGRPGFFLLMPARIANSDFYVLVVRGWIRQTGGFNVLPEIPELPSGSGVIQGIVERQPVVGFKKGQPDLGFSGWPKLLSYVDLPWYEKLLGIKLMPYVLREKGPSQENLVRDWDAFVSSTVSMPPEKHLSYAFQWFSLAAVLMIIYLVVNLKRRTEN